MTIDQRPITLNIYTLPQSKSSKFCYKVTKFGTEVDRAHNFGAEPSKVDVTRMCRNQFLACND